MNKVYFDAIVIYDERERCAFKTKFSPGINIITSENNHVGKSCLVKSLYYALGAEINFAAPWDLKNKTVSLKFSIGQETCQIVRRNKFFLLIDGNGETHFCTRVGSELTHELARVFGFSVHLQNKSTKRYEVAPPAFTYLPYFIDQDKGWVSEMYTSFEKLGQYSKADREEVFLYHLKIRDEETAKINNQLVDAQNNLSERIKERDKIDETLSILKKEFEGIHIISSSEQMEEIVKSEKTKIERILKDIAASRERIHFLQEELAFCKMQVKRVRQEKAVLKGHDSVSIRCCSNCGHIEDEDIYDFASRDYYGKNIKYILKEINNYISRIDSSICEEMRVYERLTSELNANYHNLQEKNSGYDAYVRHKGLLSSIQRLTIKLEELRKTITEAEGRLGELKKQVRSQKKDEREESQKIQQKYQSYAHQFMNQLDVGIKEGVDIDITEPLKNIAQGANLPKMIIALQAALLETMNVQETPVLFPFVVDSPGTMEASDKSKLDILNLLKRLECLPQVIISTVDYQKLCTENEDDVKVLTLSAKTSLLSSDVYKSIEEEVADIENRFQLAKRMYDVVNQKGKHAITSALSRID